MIHLLTLSHDGWLEDVTTPTILLEFPIVQVHALTRSLVVQGNWSREREEDTRFFKIYIIIYYIASDLSCVFYSTQAFHFPRSFNEHAKFTQCLILCNLCDYSESSDEGHSERGQTSNKARQAESTLICIQTL